MNQSTFSFPQLINRTTRKIELSTNTKSINECLGILLRTRPGELLGDPAYGCGMLNCLFDVKTNNNINELKGLILKAINKYIPEIIVNEIKIYANDNNNKYKITINYTLKPNDDSVTFELIV